MNWLGFRMMVQFNSWNFLDGDDCSSRSCWEETGFDCYPKLSSRFIFFQLSLQVYWWLNIG